MMRWLGRAVVLAAVVLGLGATPGCLCRTRSYGYVPTGGVVVRPVVRVAPRVRVGTPIARPVRQP